jgi:hypothetical protein
MSRATSEGIADRRAIVVQPIGADFWRADHAGA